MTEETARPRRSRPRQLLLAAALIAPFASIVALLIAFQPFASAAGGCGGG